ncbi:formyltransferase family protein [Chitinilyticum litopenaei]|uniref:formyltransferase family protein n=1 Tax=Chitinilyticum litopenaei TaxID=1121276 RepID=UPI0003FD82FA|nr:formyltransferase family protein [Chitinilyticum litopenaei]
MKTLSDVLMIAAYSARSQAYLQTLLSRGLAPGHVLLLGEAPAPAALAPAAAWLNGIRLPDLGEPLAATLAAAGIASSHIADRDINAPAVLAAIRQQQPGLIIFSGYGGQIVGRELIGAGIPILHVHSGWLPDFRGSTTVYYSLLEEGRCAASALLLDTDIDTGPVLLRKHFPAPPLGTDVDLQYDTAIRAEVLADVIEHHASTGRLPDPQAQLAGEGNSYYVIHPVLKHLALLSLPAADQAENGEPANS